MLNPWIARHGPVPDEPPPTVHADAGRDEAWTFFKAYADNKSIREIAEQFHVKGSYVRYRVDKMEARYGRYLRIIDEHGSWDQYRQYIKKMNRHGASYDTRSLEVTLARSRTHGRVSSGYLVRMGGDDWEEVAKQIQDPAKPDDQNWIRQALRANMHDQSYEYPSWNQIHLVLDPVEIAQVFTALAEIDMH